jgi:prolyl oligopeptidase
MVTQTRHCQGGFSLLPSLLVLALTPLLSLLIIVALDAQKIPTPLSTRTDNVKEVMHGVEVVDPYRWLEDQNSPETRAWIKAQNDYTESILASLPNRGTIARRLAELLRVETVNVPNERNGRYFFTRRLPDQELSSICMVQGLQGNPEVLVDPNTFSKELRLSVDLLDVSPDGSLLAFGTRQGGRDETEVRLLNVEQRVLLPDRLPLGRYHGISLAQNNTGFYYSRHTVEGPRLYFHALGSDSSKDPEVFGKGYGSDKILIPRLSEDGRYLLITVFYGAGAAKTDLYLQNLTDGDPITPLVTDIPARFLGAFGGDHLFLHTNWEAPRGRILAVDLKNPSRQNWKEIIPAGNATIRNFSAIGGRLFVCYLDNALSELRIFSAAGKRLKDVSLPEAGSVNEMSGRWSSKVAFFSFTSFAVPPLVFFYDFDKEAPFMWTRPKAPIDLDRFTFRQVWCESRDKTRIPMFLFFAPGTPVDGANPTLLTGYGGFNQVMAPSFSPMAVVWVESGGIYAVPNLRGGGEFGEDWHQAGILEKKQNVFDDFIAAAEWLIKKGYTKPARLAIAGRSNGGLLVGAALTQRPDLFEAAICGYPLLDMLRYHKFLAAPFWISEYGSAEETEQFKYLRAYSPYHHVKAGVKYPAVLFVSGDYDSRVDPLHARKMTALLQSASVSGKPALLRYDTQSGHVSGARPVNKIIKDSTDELSFLFWRLGERFQ